MRWAHDECCARLPGCQDMDRPQCYKGLARPALSDDAGRLRLAQILSCSGDGQSLSRQRLSQQCCNRKRYGVFGALERRIGFKNACAQLCGMCAQVVEGGLHEIPPKVWNSRFFGYACRKNKRRSEERPGSITFG